MRTIYNKKESFNIIKRNLFDSIENVVRAGNNGSTVIVPHVCNNINLFGAGFAAGVAKHYPIVKQNYHMLGNKNSLGYVQFVQVYQDPVYKHQLIFANMIAQNGVIDQYNLRPLNYAALVCCMENVKKYISTNIDTKENSVQIHAPKFGCGLAGGNWNFVQELIYDLWSEQSVFIYDIKK